MSYLLIASFAVSKKLEEKQQRREAEERKRQEQQAAARKRNFLTFGIALLVGALVVFLIINDRNSGSGGSSASAGVAAADAGCGEIETHEVEGQEHVEDGTDVQYATSPPTSGNHYATPADAGFSDTEIVPEQLVHNMEHGQIIVWYDSEAPGSTIDAIETVVEDDALALLATPYPDVPTGKELVFTAWGASQACEDFSSEVFCEFRREFQGRGPEQVGIPTFDEECSA
jgi:hypothetical protein